VRFSAADADVGKVRRLLEQRIQAVNGILSGGRSIDQ
jgi:hypothetical protein